MKELHLILLFSVPVLFPLTHGFSLFNTISSFFQEASSVVNTVKDIYDIIEGEYPRNVSAPISEDSHLNISGLATKYNYTLEEHDVTTEDGYILKMHRLPNRNGTVVFLMHGILDSSDSWVIQGPDKALAYILADQGFDVWMGNARGNKHADKHLTLNSSDPRFWQFSWEEIGTYDLPAMIDYVLNVTNEPNLYYIGYSQGTTSFYVLCSMKPEYNKKIKIMFSLAPVAYMSNTKSPIVKTLSPAYNILGYYLSNFNVNSPSAEFLNKISAVFCSGLSSTCDDIVYLLVGKNNMLIDETVLPVIHGHMPCGSSTLQFEHYGQLVQSGRFCRYDFGERNMEIYGNEIAPAYDLRAINVPIAMYYSGNDWLSNKVDVEKLMSELPNVIDSYFIESFNHLDFMYATAAKDEVYMRILDLITNNDS